MIVLGVMKLNYELLLSESDKLGLIVKEKPLKYNNGRIKGNRIAIRKDMNTAEKACVLAEELGHYYTTVGNILDQNKVNNRKQELKARIIAYDKMIGLIGIVDAYKAGCRNKFEISEYLGVTEEFLIETLNHYQSKYGLHASVGNYVIYFEPLGVLEIC